MPKATTIDESYLAQGALLSVLVCFAAAVLSPAPVTVAASGLCLALIIRLLWSADEPPILFLPAVFQWSEVATPPLSTIWKQVPLNQLSDSNADIESAALYGLAAVGVLTVALRLGSGRSKQPVFAERLRLEASVWRYRDVAVVAFTALGLGYLAAFVSNFGGPTRELFNQLSGIKYVGLFALAYWCLVRRSHMLVFAAVVAFEVVFGMTGFFAEFKNSILTFLVAALAARPKLRRVDIASVAAAGMLLFGVATFWSEVKPSYRAFVNQGTGGQVVLEPIEDRIRFLANAVGTMESAEFADGFDRLVARHGYIEYLALTMQNVPFVVPHENGGLSLAVLRHISVPRILFPDKAVLPNDTEITSRYTGIPFLLSESTSISIGYLGELYIDFGLVGGLLAVAVIGGLTGFAYKTLRDQSRGSALLIAGLCLMIVLPLAYFGQAYSKTVGALVFSTVIAFILRIWLPLATPSRLARPAPDRTVRQDKAVRSVC